MDLASKKIFPSELNKDHNYFMAHAYNQAITAWEKDEVPVGAVIVHKNMIISSSYNQTRSTNDPTAHAEILAISKAANTIKDWRLNECILYVTKEPCPMCSGALVISRIKKVYYGIKDSKMGCLGGAINLGNLPESNHKFQSIGGIMEQENQMLLSSFFKTKRLNKAGLTD